MKGRVKLWRIGLVHRVISRRHTVGFKRVWMRGVSEEHPTPLFISLAVLVSPGQHKSGAGRNERTTTQTEPFQANPLGRTVNWFWRCSLLTDRFRYARR